MYGQCTQYKEILNKSRNMLAIESQALKIRDSSQARWFMPIIPGTWGARVGGLQV